MPLLSSECAIVDKGITKLELRFAGLCVPNRVGRSVISKSVATEGAAMTVPEPSWNVEVTSGSISLVNPELWRFFDQKELLDSAKNDDRSKHH